MMDALSWRCEGERLVLQGELDQNFLLPLWEARGAVTPGISVIDLTALSRVDTAGLALLMHFIELIRSQGRNVVLEGVSEKVATLKGLYNLPAEMIP